jgi:hypothetical protein
VALAPFLGGCPNGCRTPYWLPEIGAGQGIQDISLLLLLSECFVD